MSNQKKIIDILRNDEMVEAIKKNDVRQIKKLIDSGYDVNNNLIKYPSILAS